MNVRVSRLIAALCLGVLLASVPPAARAVEPTPANGRTLKFEVYKDAKGEFRWRLKAANGAELATAGQGYKAKADAMAGIDRLIAGAGAGAADDKHKFETYTDKGGDHRWRLVASNGQVVAASSEGYKAKTDAMKAVEVIKARARTAKVDDQTG